jgi:tetratricopeptide (TPR) repeat protein
MAEENPASTLFIPIQARDHMANPQTLAQLRQAYAAHQAGNLNQAERIYRKALAAEPNDAGPHHGLALIFKDRGQLDVAIGYFQEAINRDPFNDSIMINAAAALVASKRLPEARRALESVLLRNRDNVPALRALATLSLMEGYGESAVQLIGRAANLAPGDPMVHYDFGTIAQAMGETRVAMVAFERAFQLNPKLIDAANRLGNLMIDVWIDPERAESLFRQVLAIDRDNVTAMGGLASVLTRRGQVAESIGHLEFAARRAPDDPSIQLLLGWAWRTQGDLDKAEAALNQAIALDPLYVGARINLAMIMQDRARYDEALDMLRRLLDRAPNEALAEAALGYLLLSLGQWQEGWRRHEARFRTPAFTGRGGLASPVWRGEDIDGMIVFIEPEQGFGDIIQFARFAPLVAAKGARVMMGMAPPLMRLFASMKGVDALIPLGAEIPGHHYRVPMMSLPALFQSTPETLPNAVPYLAPPEDAVERWRERLASERRFKVGLVWAGNKEQLNDSNRSMPATALLPLTKLDTVALYSLQVGPRAGELAALSSGSVVDLSPELTDFAETAAAVTALDLTITVCTSVSHLVGALGRPGWVLLSTSPDWRWLLDREDSPWYPTLRLFRQRGYRDWDELLGRVAAELESLAAEKAAA